jgi:hypothetical protein
MYTELFLQWFKSYWPFPSHRLVRLFWELSVPQWFTVNFTGLSLADNFSCDHGRTGRKKLGGPKKICLTFLDCARVVKNNFQNYCRRERRSDYEKFLLDSIFPTKLTEFPTKLTEFVPFIFIISQYCPTVNRILPDCEPNIARLALFAQQTGGAVPPPPVRPCMRHAIKYIVHAKWQMEWSVFNIYGQWLLSPWQFYFTRFLSELRIKLMQSSIWFGLNILLLFSKTIWKKIQMMCLMF